MPDISDIKKSGEKFKFYTIMLTVSWSRCTGKTVGILFILAGEIFCQMRGMILSGTVFNVSVFTKTFFYFCLLNEFKGFFLLLVNTDFSITG